MSARSEHISERNDFLRPEERDGFYVDSGRKAVWKVLLDILETLIGICDRHGLQYSLIGGSLLGAMRHKGIIPWDDDIDIAMPRPDYEKLQQILPKELPPHLFMQTSATDFEYDITHVKIRDSRTTALEMTHVKMGRRYNMGIFLDVFPLDGLSPDDKVRAGQARFMKIIRIIYALSLRRKHETLKSRIGGLFSRMARKCLGESRLYKMREGIFARYSCADCEEVGLGLAEWGFRDCFRWRSEWFSEYIIVPFEYLDVKVPKMYDEILTKQYGDWRVPKQVPALHNGIVFDTEKDYKTVLQEKYGYESQK